MPDADGPADRKPGAGTIRSVVAQADVHRAIRNQLPATGWSSECSNLEDEPFHGNGEADLRDCVRGVDADLNVPVVTFDGRPVQMKEAESGLLVVDLPDNNIFGVPVSVRRSSPSAMAGWRWCR